MKLSYFPETDTLYIELLDGPSIEAQEVGEGMVADFGCDGRVVGIEIEQASSRVDVRKLETSGLPLAKRLAA